MGISGGPKIVRDSSLILELDAADRNSYQSGSTTWFDLTPNNNGGSLVNGPTYTGSNGGAIVFNGVNNSVLINSGSTSINPTTAITVASFLNAVSYSANYGPIVFKQNNYAGMFEQYVLTYLNGTIYFVITGVDRVQKVLSSSANYANQTVYAVATCDTVTDELKLYINGSLTQTGSFTSTFDIADTPINIGGTSILKSGATYTGWLNGRIYTVQIYNKALSATEIQQNYNQLKSRFNL